MSRKTAYFLLAAFALLIAASLFLPVGKTSEPVSPAESIRSLSTAIHADRQSAPDFTAETPAPPSPAPMPEQPAPIHFEVLVLAETDRSPIADATVLLTRDYFRNMAFFERRELAKVITDATGRARIDGNVPLATKNGELRLAAVADGYAQTQATLDKDNIGETVELLLPAGAIISGHVQDPDGNRIAGARFHHLYAQQEPKTRGTPLLVETTSDDDGAFNLTGLPAESKITFTVEADGYIRQLQYSLEAGDTNAVVVMQPAEAALAGRVLTYTGKPMPKVTIRLENSNYTWEYRETDANGEFRFNSLPAGNVRVIASHPNIRDNTRQITMAKNSEHFVTFTSSPMLVITGTATDKETGKPVAGIWVRNFNTYVHQPSGRDIEVVTGEDGQYYMEVPQGPVNITFEAPAGFALTGSYQQVVLGQPGETQVVDIGLRRATLLSGRLLDQRGNPLPNNYIVLFEVSNKIPEPRELGRFTSETDGVFARYVLPDRDYLLRAWNDDAEGEKEVSVARDILPPFVEIVLKDYGALEGRVTSDGNPVEGLSMQWSRVLPDGRFKDRTLYHPGKTDADGYYRLNKVLPGEVQVRPDPKARLGLYEPSLLLVEVEPGQVTSNVDFTVVPGAEFKGVVVNEDGEPVASARVQLQSNATTWTNEDGHFVLKGLQNSHFPGTLVVAHTKYDSITLGDIALEDSPLTVELKSPKSLTIHVTKHQRPVQRFRYHLMKDYYSSVMMPTRGTDWRIVVGTSRIEEPQLASGMYNYYIEELGSDGEPTGYTAILNVMKRRGEAQEEHVELVPVCDIRGILVSKETGKPLPSKQINIYLLGERTVQLPRMIKSAEDGTFEFERIPLGKYRLTVYSRILANMDLDLTTCSDAGNVRFVAPTTEVIRVRIVGPDGEFETTGSFPFTLTNLNSTEPPRTGALTPNEQGYSVLPAIEPASYELEITHPETGEKKKERINPDFTTVNFDFSNDIAIYGTITINGANTGRSPRLLIPTRAENIYLGAGPYESKLAPGTFTVYSYARDIFDRPFPFWECARFTIKPEPARQEFNFDIWLADVDVVLLFPEGEDSTPGMLFLKRGDNYWRRPIEGESLLLTDLVADTYSAFYNSHDGRFMGETLNTQLLPNQQNTIVIEVYKTPDATTPPQYPTFPAP